MFGAVPPHFLVADDFCDEIGRRAVNRARNARDDAHDIPIEPTSCDPFVFGLKVKVTTTLEELYVLFVNWHNV